MEKPVRRRSWDDAKGLKRRRTEATQPNIDIGEYNDGNIIHIKLHNFVTYSDTEFWLLPTLNMIIGPNGTGKSTFVCLICIGLGGKPSLLGRARFAADFIKEGEDFCSIETTLRHSENNGGTVTVTRRMTRSQNSRTREKSEWLIDGVVKTENHVAALLQLLNVQLDNLCCFLPQDKVSSFALLTPSELLRETERAADPQLLVAHTELIELDSARLSIVTEIDSHKRVLDDLKSKHERLRADAEKYRRYKEKLDELELHEKLIPYAIVSDLKRNAAYLKRRKNDLVAKYNEFVEFTNPLADEIAAIDSQADAKLQEWKQLEQKSTEIKQEIQLISSIKGGIKEEIERLQNKRIGILGRADRLNARIKSTEQHIAELEQEKSKLQTVNPEELESLRGEQSKARDKQEAIEPELQDLNQRLNDSYQKIQSWERNILRIKEQIRLNDKISVLDKVQSEQYRATKRAVLELRKHPELKGKVFEPPVLSLSVPDQKYAKYFEKFVDVNTKLSFTFASQEIYQDVSKGVLKGHNVSHRYPGTQRKPQFLTAELQEMGFDGLLIDFARGPQEVLDTIYDCMHDLPVRTTELEPGQLQVIQNMTNEKGNPFFTKFCAGDTIYTLKRSAYGSRQIITQTEQLRSRGPTHFDSKGAAETAESEIMVFQKRINDEKEALQPLLESVESLKRGKTEAVAAYDNAKAAYQRLQKLNLAREKVDNNLTRQREQLEELKAKPDIDVTRAVSKIDLEISKQMAKRVELTRRMIDLTAKLSSQNAVYVAAQYSRMDLMNRAQALRNMMTEWESFLSRLHHEMLEAKKRYDKARNLDEVQRLKVITSQYLAELRQKMGELALEYQQQGQLTEAHLRARVNLIRMEIGGLEDASLLSVEKLRHIESEMEKLQVLVPNLEQKLLGIESLMNEKRLGWERRLDALIANILENFSKKFVAVASAGEVRLDKAESGIKDWRLELLVKFRDDHELRVLDGVTESGGERAVSTIFYMLSLQGLTNSPFRVVDEINQGMDPKNESIVHKFMVESACQSDENGKFCQYFLITPKLLTRLFYHERMAVHCIMANHCLEGEFDDH